MDQVMEGDGEQPIIDLEATENGENPNETQQKYTTIPSSEGIASSRIAALSIMTQIQQNPLFEQQLTIDTTICNSSPPLASSHRCTCNVATNWKRSMIDLGFLKSLATNPLIIASVVALLVNLINGPELPRFVTKVSNTIAASFSAPALFVVGVSMYGKFELLVKNPIDLLLSSVLVLTKVLVLPNLMRTLALMILPRFAPTEEIHYLVDFSFLYGLLPTAPTACIIANQYGILSNVVSISMLLSTFISAPLLLASSVIINPSTVIKVSLIENILSQTMKLSSVVTLILSSLTLYAFWKSKQLKHYTSFADIPQVASRSLKKIKQNPIHVFLFLLAFSQTIVGLGGLIWYFVDEGIMDIGTQNVPSLMLRETTSMPNQSRTAHLETLEAPTQVPSSLAASIANSDPSSSSILENWPNVDLQPPSPIERPVIVRDREPETIVPEIEDHGIIFKIFRVAQYVLSSYGLFMSKYVIFSMILTMTALRLRGHVVASKVSTLMVQLYLAFGFFLIVWLIFDSDRLMHSPTDASLPCKPISLYLRLIYNIIFISASVPLYALIIRSYNQTKYKQQKLNKGSNGNVINRGALADRRNFVTSNASLSSDTSSAMTTNTNLESSNITNSAQIVFDSNNNQNTTSDSLSIVLDTGTLEPSKKGLVNSSSLDFQPSEPLSDVESSQPYELNDPTNGDDVTISPNQNRRDTASQATDFNRYSMLIVFMIIDALHNLTTISQKLLQDQPYGTFRQIEIVNVAMEFGQGLLTFLIYRMKGLLS